MKTKRQMKKHKRYQEIKDYRSLKKMNKAKLKAKRIIKFPLSPKLLDAKIKQYEVQCGVCGEFLIVESGDLIHFTLDENLQVDAVFCYPCFKRRIKRRIKCSYK